MKANRLVVASASLLLFAGIGCVRNYAPPPPPPPPPPVEVAPIIQLAERNGFEIGRRDGAAAVDSGYPPEPRRTRAYYDCPGYDSQLGPFDAYCNAFRLAYLRGYDRGYRRG